MSSPAPQRPALARGARSSRSLNYEHRLSIIDENSDQTYRPPPRVPPRAVNRPLGRMFGLTLSLRRHGGPPPPYSEYDDVVGPKGEKFADLRENRRFLSKRQRGGWKRLAIIAILIAGVIAGIVTGIIYGLHEKGKKASSPTPGSSSPTNPFPAGAWTFTTFLSTVGTACTSNPATWLCFPYNTYNSSATASMTTFNWIIKSTDLSKSSFVVSSSDNPFALTFTNVTLQITDAGLPTEAYTFSAPMDKTVMPRVGLTLDNAATSCMYQGTTFEARLYTKIAKTYPSAAETNAAIIGRSSLVNNNPIFKPWPHAVAVAQTIKGGPNVPTCYKTFNGNTEGQPIEGLIAQPPTTSCSCEYMNYGT